MTKNLLFTAIVAMSIMVLPNAHPQIEEPAASVISFDKVEPINVGDKVSIRVISASTVGMTRIDMKKGGNGPHHNHPDEGLIMLAQGQLRATSRGTTWLPATRNQPWHDLDHESGRRFRSPFLGPAPGRGAGRLGLLRGIRARLNVF